MKIGSGCCYRGPENIKADGGKNQYIPVFGVDGKMSLDVRRSAPGGSSDRHADTRYRGAVGADDRPGDGPEGRSGGTAGGGGLCVGVFFEDNLVADNLIGNMKRAEDP